MNLQNMRLYHKDKIVLLLMLDLLSMTAAFILALFIGHRMPMTPKLIQHYIWGLGTLLFSVVIIFFILDLYSLHKIPSRFASTIFMIAFGLIVSAILVTFVFFFFRNTVPRAVFLLFYVFSLMVIVAIRYSFNMLTLSLIYWRLLIAGAQKPCEKVIQIVQERKYLHSHILGYLSDEEKEDYCYRDVYRLGTIEQLLSIVEREAVDHVIVATTHIDDHLTKLLLECMRKKIKVTHFNQFIESVAGKIPIEYLDAGWFFYELSSMDKRYYWYVKRTMDLCISLIGICIVLPFLPLLAMLIKLDSPGPVFYSQTRIGRDRKPFRLWKLRTMVQNADGNNIYWTTENDKRITRLGKLLRKIRIDEIPQLINILKGDMTLIGPRPEAESLVEMYRKEIPYYQERHIVTPGITGWAQINYPYGNSIEDSREKLKYDFYYIKNRGIVLDLIIILRTIKTVMTGKGAL